MTDEKITLDKARGKVVAIVFRRVGDQRSAEFLAPLSHFCAGEPDIQCVTVSYLKSKENIAREMTEMETELNGISYVGAAGFDPDTVSRSTFEDFGAIIGSATFIVIDRDGRVVWFQQDPYKIHLNFAKAILRRAAGA